MATKKKANKFLTDVDLCNNQIKNATWEHWTEDVLPSENLFDGRMLFLEKDIPAIIEGKPYTYEAGSVIICHKIDGEFCFLKQLSSLQTEDVTGAIKELWRSKAGIIRGYATKAALDAALGESKTPVVYESDIGIVLADVDYDQATTMYMAAKNGGSWEGKVADKWDFISIVGKDWQPALDKKFNCVTSTETGGASFSVPYGVDVSGGLPLDEEGLNNLKLKTIWLDNRTNRVDTYTIPGIYKLKPIFDGNEVKVAGLYGKTAAEKKVDVFQGTDNKYRVLAVGVDGNVKPSDISGYITYEGRDGVKTEPKSTADPSQGTWIEADWDKVAHYPGKATATEEYNLPYHIDTPVQDADKITAKFYTVALNKDNTKKDFSISIPKADITGNKAGLYTKDMNEDLVTAINNEATTRANADTTLQNNIDAEKTRAETAEATKITKLGDVSGAPAGTKYRFPYHFETPVQSQTDIKATFHTRILDDNSDGGNYTITIPAADIVNDKAGLYTKALADVKADLSYVNTELAKKVNLFGNAPGTTEPLRLPYFFYITPTTDKITVTTKTVGMDDHSLTGEYHLDVPAATQTEIGLMLAEDKKKLDEILTDTETSEMKTWSSKKINDTIAEYQAEHKGTFNTHEDFEHALPITANINDYVIILNDTYTPSGETELIHFKECWRYVYVESGGEFGGHWNAQVRISNMPFTKGQWSTINSWIYNSANPIESPAITGGIDVQDLMKKLPKETYSGLDYRFPFHIEDPVQNQSNITAVFHTLVLNDGTTRNRYTVTIPSADIAGDKAGLYTKTLAEAKQDKLTAITDAEIDALAWS